jgi:hypothetical protein
MAHQGRYAFACSRRLAACLPARPGLGPRSHPPPPNLSLVWRGGPGPTPPPPPLGWRGAPAPRPHSFHSVGEVALFPQSPLFIGLERCPCSMPPLFSFGWGGGPAPTIPPFHSVGEVALFPQSPLFTRLERCPCSTPPLLSFGWGGAPPPTPPPPSLGWAGGPARINPPPLSLGWGGVPCSRPSPLHSALLHPPPFHSVGEINVKRPHTGDVGMAAAGWTKRRTWGTWRCGEEKRVSERMDSLCYKKHFTVGNTEKAGRLICPVSSVLERKVGKSRCARTHHPLSQSLCLSLPPSLPPPTFCARTHQRPTATFLSTSISLTPSVSPPSPGLCTLDR